MAEKKSMSMLAAKAVSRVKEQPTWQNRWGSPEHLALHRYMAVDALATAQSMMVGKARNDKAGKPMLDKEGKPVVWTLASAVNAILRDAHMADPELGYASNFDKLLKKCGEIPEGNEYE